jgi:hypothetical protein
MLQKSKFDKYLYIENNVVYAKEKCEIYLDLSEYKEINEEFDLGENDIGINEVNTGLYEIPGYFNIEFKDSVDLIKFFFPYNVFIFEGSDPEITSKYMKFIYEPDEKVFTAKFKKEETNIKILDKLFENGIKYLSNDMGLLIYNIWKQVLPTMNVPWHHFEVIVSQLYGKQENGIWKPVRLIKDQEYSEQTVLNTKKSAHYFGTTTGFLYGYSNDALLHSITTEKDPNKEETFMEKLIRGQV